MQARNLLVCVVFLVLTKISTLCGQVEVIKPETPIANIEDAACYPDVSDLKNSENFVIVFPELVGLNIYDARFQVFDSDGEAVTPASLIEEDISTTTFVYGIGAASNNTLFSCIYPELISANQAYTYSKQFLHSGGAAGDRILLNDLPSSSPDGSFRTTMPYSTLDTHLVSENRIEYSVGNESEPTDLDVMACGFPVKFISPQDEIGGGYSQIDPLDQLRVDDLYETDATSLESYPASAASQWILFSWTREIYLGDNHVFSRSGRYHSLTKTMIWANDPVQLSTQDIGAQSQGWTDVDLTEDNDFLVVWNQRSSEPGIWISKLDYQGNVLLGYPKRLIEISDETLYPSVATFNSLSSIDYVVTWAQYFPGEGKWNIVGVPVRGNDVVIGSPFVMTNSTRLAYDGGFYAQHKMDAIYSPYTGFVRFAIAWAGEEVNDPSNKDIYYAVYQIRPPDF